jgi:hypothetical protein
MAHFWNMRRISAALIFGLMVVGAPANSAIPAEQLYTEGRYSEAISVGEAEGGSIGFTVAARAAFADAELRETPCLECLSRAGELAREAISADPENAEAHLLLVAALGRRARLIGFFASQREGVASQTDEAISKALMLESGSAFALAVRGAWHFEVVSQAGRFLGSTLYGARAEDGQRYFAEAIAREPENLVIRYQYALSLEACDFDAERGEVEMALEAATLGRPRDAYEGAINARATRLLGLLRDGMEEAFSGLMSRYRGDP